MSDSSPMPFGLPEESREFSRRMEEVKDDLRKQFGRNVPATSAVDEALLKSLEEMREGRTPSGFWTRVTRRAIDLLRTRQRQNRLLEKIALESADDDSGDPVECLAARELYESLVRAAESLTPTEREVWLLHCEGKCENEISALLNKSHSAVKMALSRARRKMRERLSDPPDRKE